MNPFEHQKHQARSNYEFDHWWRNYLFVNAEELPTCREEADRVFSQEKKAAKAAWFHVKHKEVKQ